MRPELDQLVIGTLAGDDDSAIVLKSLLENCRQLIASSADQWEGQGAERTWPDLTVENIAPELAFFLPTPAELDEAKRRLRLALVEDGRLDRQVMTALHSLVDHTVLVPLVDVLEGYGGDPSRYAEVSAAMNILGRATHDAAEVDILRARRALEHVRDIGGEICEQGYSLRYWANNALVGFDDDDAHQRMEDEHPLPDDWAERAAGSRARFDEWSVTRTAEVLVTVDPLDNDCAGHLYAWTAFGDGPSRMGSTLNALSGPSVEADEGFNAYLSLPSPIWVSRVGPASLPRLFDDIAAARWKKPEPVQVLVKDEAPYFVLYMLSEGKLRRCAPEVVDEKL